MRTASVSMISVTVFVASTALGPLSGCHEAGRAFRPGGITPSRGIVATTLRCEYLSNPLAVDAPTPRLSWLLESNERGQRQTAYRILAASSPQLLERNQGDLWDSGVVNSDQSIQVEYRGKPLPSRTRVWWKVRAWDKNNVASRWSDPATWCMGLLEPADWQARWVEAPINPPTFKAAHNGYHSALAKRPDVAKWVMIDLGCPQRIEAVQLHPAQPYDWKAQTPGFLFPVRFRIETSDSADFAKCKIVVDQTAQDVPNPGTHAPRYTFEAVSARYVRLFVTKLAHRDADVFAFALAQMRVFAGQTNVALNNPVTAPDCADGSWSRPALTNGLLNSQAAVTPERLPAPMMRKSFRIGAPVTRAVAYVSAMGLYELHLNGQRVGDQILAPEWTDYHKRIQYQAYDVTHLLKKGDNAVGAILGDGWYAGRIGLAFIVPGGPAFGIYGPIPRLIAQIEVQLSNGQTERIVTDSSWRVTLDGPTRINDILDGETQDARKELPGWDTAAFEESAWKPVRVVDKVSARLVAQCNEPIRVTRELKPKGLSQPKPGVYVYDLGQNMVGWVRFKARAAGGTTMVLRYGEAINPDGTLYTANLRGAAQIDRYTFRSDRPEVFEPRFTYHGFRFVEVSGLPSRPALEDMTGRVFHSSSPDVGQFACSSGLLTQLWENIFWTQRANLMSTPTDCPQRDERLGWMGDIQVYSQTACFNMDMAGFFTKWVRDVRDDQADDGRYPDFAPHPFGYNQRFSGVPAWGDAGTVVPWRTYQNYGDTRMLAEHLESAKRWVEYIRGKNPDLIWRNGRNNDYNDWLNADTLKLNDWPKTGGAVPQEVLATAFFAHSTEIVGKMAAVLGRKDDAERYARLFADIKAAFCNSFVAPDGRITGDTQAGYALALHFNLIPNSQREAAVRHMIEGIARYKGHISTGIQSTIRMMLELTRTGHNDLAYTLINNRSMPSWLYSIDQGATSVWERWDGYVHGRGFQDPGMNSLNHWAIGAVGEWIYRVILGINADDTHPAYKHFVIRPRSGGGLTWAKGQYHSIHGLIAVGWTLDHGRLDVSIPANTTATVYVPGRNIAAVRESGHPATEAEGVRFLRVEDGTIVFEVDSGRYSFTVR